MLLFRVAAGVRFSHQSQPVEKATLCSQQEITKGTLGSDGALMEGRSPRAGAEGGLSKTSLYTKKSLQSKHVKTSADPSDPSADRSEFDT